ncbi:MAG: AtpZ/AtpI family protein [Salinivirgaceae bacterium]|nr:AtpZ/AtpI family protein [Salinivirgaceae bacterium]
MKKKRNNDGKKSSMYFFARYSGLAFEMLGIIFLGTFGGHKIDEHRGTGFPLWTLILSLLSIAIAMYVVLKDLIRNDS